MERNLAAGSESVDILLDFLVKDENGWRHPFFSTEDPQAKCQISREDIKQHQKSILSQVDRQREASQIAWIGMRKRLKSKPKETLSTSRANSTSPRPVTPTHPSCPICMNAVVTPWRHAECSLHIFCESCARDYVMEKVNEGDNITCPGENCSFVLTVESIRGLVGTQLTEKYIHFRNRARLARDTTIKFCSTPNCQGYIRKSPDTPLRSIRCFICKRSLCSSCGENWHAYLSCEEVFDLELAKWVQGKEVQKCPNCTRYIEKDDGCDHMTCIVCKYEWCWQCREGYTRTHYVSDSPDFCPVYRARNRANAQVTDEEVAMPWRAICAAIFVIPCMCLAPSIFVLGLEAILPIFTVKCIMDLLLAANLRECAPLAIERFALLSRLIVLFGMLVIFKMMFLPSLYASGGEPH